MKPVPIGLEVNERIEEVTELAEVTEVEVPRDDPKDTLDTDQRAAPRFLVSISGNVQFSLMSTDVHLFSAEGEVLAT